jgi:hypothetical protein
LGCVLKKETNPPNDFKLKSQEDFVKLLVENGGTYNEGEYTGVDQYGNSYELHFSLSDVNFIGCRIKNIPDMKVLLPLKNYVEQLMIWEDSPITDISFLVNFHQLKLLNIGNSNVLNYEPLGKLVSLNWLAINNEYPVTIDCAIFANLANLSTLMLSTDRIINLETIFDKSHEEFKLPKFEFISFGEYSFVKIGFNYFMSKVEGLTLTPEDKISREKYGNNRGEKFIDQYGNIFYNESWSWVEDISVDILGTPDMDVLLRLKDNITNLYFYENSPITDISFLSDFSRLKNLQVINPNILTLKSMDSLSNLGSLSIDLTIGKKFLMENGYTGILDFLLSFRNRDKLDVLFLIGEDIKLDDEMYLLAQEIFKISGIQRIKMGENEFQRGAEKERDYW